MEAFILRLANDKAKKEVGPELPLLFRSMSQAPSGSLPNEELVLFQCLSEVSGNGCQVGTWVLDVPTMVLVCVAGKVFGLE